MGLLRNIGKLIILISIGIPFIPNAQAIDKMWYVIIGQIESRKQWCDEYAPGFMERSKINYEYWKEENKIIISELNVDSKYHEGIELQKQELSKRYKKGKGVSADSKYDKLRLAMLCNDEWIDRMGGPEISEDSFSSPSKTLELFENAVIQGDHELAVSCLSSDAADGYITNMMMEEKGYLDGETMRDRVLIRKGVPKKIIQIDEKTVEMRQVGQESSVTKFKLISGN